MCRLLSMSEKQPALQRKMMDKAKLFSPDEVANIADASRRMRVTVDAFNQAMNTEDFDTGREIAEFVLGNEIPNRLFKIGFQWHCLNWLTNYYRNSYVQSGEDSPEADAALRHLLNTAWKYKWVVPKLPYDTTVSREEIAQANQAMRQLYDDFQCSRESVEKALTEQSILMGDVAAAREHFALWQAAEADDLSDCPACEQDSLVQYYHFIGDYAQVLSCAEPILSGELSCAEVPHITYQYVVDALIRTGRPEQAEELLEEAFALITESDEDNVRLLPPLILAASQLGRLDWAEDWLDEYSDDIFATISNNDLPYFDYITCIVPLKDDALENAQQVAQELDQRNGNSYYQDKLTLLFQKTMLH